MTGLPGAEFDRIEDDARLAVLRIVHRTTMLLAGNLLKADEKKDLSRDCNELFSSYLKLYDVLSKRVAKNITDEMYPHLGPIIEAAYRLGFQTRTAPQAQRQYQRDLSEAARRKKTENAAKREAWLRDAIVAVWGSRPLTASDKFAISIQVLVHKHLASMGVDWCPASSTIKRHIKSIIEAQKALSQGHS